MHGDVAMNIRQREFMPNCDGDRCPRAAALRGYSKHQKEAFPLGIWATVHGKCACWSEVAHSLRKGKFRLTTRSAGWDRSGCSEVSCSGMAGYVGMCSSVLGLSCTSVLQSENAATCARIATVSPLKITFGGSQGKKKHTTWSCAICGEKYDWKQPNMLLVVQTGDSMDQAKVFKANAVPQGLCENLINALKLLANQQEDGDGLLQNIVKDLGNERAQKVSRNESALEVGYLDRGMGTCKVRKPKVPEGCQEVTVRESPDELTLRAEEVGTLKAYINVDHIEKERWCLPLVDYDWCAFCQVLCKGIE